VTDTKSLTPIYGINDFVFYVFANLKDIPEAVYIGLALYTYTFFVGKTKLKTTRTSFAD
jgi:hypothetical protein